MAPIQETARFAAPMEVLIVLLTICLLPFFLVGVVVLLFWWRIQTAEFPRCPTCLHSATMLVTPVCTECGTSLEPGVVGPGRLTPRTVPLVWALIVLVGLWVAVFTMIFLAEPWEHVLRTVGASQKQMVHRWNHGVVFQGEDALFVNVETQPFRADLHQASNPLPIRVVLTLRIPVNGRRSWDSRRFEVQGLVRSHPEHRWVIDPSVLDDLEPHFEALKANHPVGSGSFFSWMLNDPEGFKRLNQLARDPFAEADDPAVDLAFPIATVQAREHDQAVRWTDAAGFWWFPIAGLGGAAGFVVGWLLFLVLRRSYRLQPFSPAPSPPVPPPAPPTGERLH